MTIGFKQWEYKGITWCVIMKDGQLESFKKMKEKYDLDTHDFYRYLQLRNYIGKEIRSNTSGEINGVVQVVIKAYKDKKIKTISELYKSLIKNRHSTKYIKEKWESELNINISDENWLKMWRTHNTCTNSRIVREFSWKNLARFFITPKIKSRQLKKNIPCWRDCGIMNVDHTHVF